MALLQGSENGLGSFFRGQLQGLHGLIQLLGEGSLNLGGRTGQTADGRTIPLAICGTFGLREKDL